MENTKLTSAFILEFQKYCDEFRPEKYPHIETLNVILEFFKSDIKVWTDRPLVSSRQDGKAQAGCNEPPRSGISKGTATLVASA